MVRKIALRCTLALLIFSSVRMPIAASAPTGAPEMFGAVPQVSDVVLNPAGALLAWHDESGPAPCVVIFDIAGRKNLRSVRVAPDAKLRSLEWADNDTLLMTMTFKLSIGDLAEVHRHEAFRTLALDVSTGKTRTLLMDSGYHIWAPGAYLISWHTSKPGFVVMGAFAVFAGSFGWKFSLFEVDTHSDKVSVLGEGHETEDNWVVDANGSVVGRGEWQPANRIYSIYGKDGSAWREILHRESLEQMNLFNVAFDGKAALAIGDSEDGHARLWAVPLDGSGAKDMLPDATEDVVDIAADPLTGAPVAAQLGGLQQVTRWLDPQAARQQQVIVKAFPAHEARIVSRSESSTRVVAEVQGPSSAPVYYLVDYLSHKADIVGEAYPSLKDTTLGEVRAITYKARDGTAIPAYLTLPPGKQEKKLPLIVLPHSGPADRDDHNFNWWAQFLAVRGYLVLQPQFRGSTGFGAAFRRAGYRQWGGLMQDDVSDGVRALIDQGIADSRRVCIVGAGRYAGYVALAGAAFTPELYACAASINGVSNLPEMLGYMRDHDGQDPQSLKEQIGSASDRDVIDKSPVHAAGRVRAPVLLIYAIQDTVVPASQSNQMAEALRKVGASVTVVRLEGEDHSLSSSGTRVQVLRELDTFLSTNLH